MLKFKWSAYRSLFYYFLYFSLCLKYYISFVWCSNLESFCIAGENIKWYSCRGNTMAVLQTIKHGRTTWSSFSTSRCILKRIENRDLNKYLHTQFIAGVFKVAKRWKHISKGDYVHLTTIVKKFNNSGRFDDSWCVIFMVVLFLFSRKVNIKLVYIL